MRKIFGIFCLALLAVALHHHCAAHADATGDLTKTIDVSGVKRTYVLHVPAGWDGKRPLPVVLLFHGYGGQGAGMAKMSGFDAVADREGVLAVYPDGLQRQWSFVPEDSKTGDVAFVRALIEQLKRDYSVDKNRIYAAGMSNGGFFSQRMGFELPDEIAAVASVAATLPVRWANAVKDNKGSKRPLPILFMHGTEDPLVPYQGGALRGHNRGTMLSLKETALTWAAYNGCGKDPAKTYLPDADPKDGTRIFSETYSGTQAGSIVVAYTVEGGGHGWPGGMQYLPERAIGKTSHDINASEVIWQFFAKYSKTK